MLSMMEPLSLLMDPYCVAPLRTMEHASLLMDAASLRTASRPLSLAPSPCFRAAEEAYELTLSAPGVASTDVAIEVHGSRCMTIKGATTAAGRTRRLDYSFTLPADANPAEATAEAADGLVTVRIPKAPETCWSIAVTAGEPPAPLDDVKEADRPFTITIVAAGIAPNELALTAEGGGVLKVRGASKRTGAKLERAFKLPRNADAAKAVAFAADGLLTVRVPKMAAAETKRIEINKPAEAPEATHAELIGMDTEAKAEVAAAAEAEAPAGVAEEDEGVMV